MDVPLELWVVPFVLLSLKSLPYDDSKRKNVANYHGHNCVFAVGGHLETISARGAQMLTL